MRSERPWALGAKILVVAMVQGPASQEHSTRPFMAVVGPGMVVAMSRPSGMELDAAQDLRRHDPSDCHVDSETEGWPPASAAHELMAMLP